MRKPYQLLFLLLGVLMLASPLNAMADEVTADQDSPEAWKLRALQSGAAKLRTSLANDPDTIWIGHIANPAWVPKDRNGVNVPGVPAGGVGPWKIGRGENLPGFGPGTHFNGVWDFDSFQAGETDSLQGWWPLARPFQSGDTTTPDDKKRPFYGLDYGNQGNYVLNQGTANKRTFGVTGYWHRDRGSADAPLSGALDIEGTDTVNDPGPNPEWASIGAAGTASAWCGLRAHGDLSAIDDAALGGTGNPFNGTILDRNGNNSYNQTGSLSPQGTDKNYPGYGSQWDQMLYRDVTLAGGDALRLQFRYVTGLSAIRGGSATSRTGYYWKDPIKNATANDGNYISATDAEASVSGPVDSFSVYVGVPVEPVAGASNDYIASDLLPKEIYDPQRRWFSEVIRTNGPMVKVHASTGLSGSPPAGSPPTTQTVDVTIPNAGSLANAIAAGGGRVRVVFRIKTNRGSDDEDFTIQGHTSYTRGAAIIDDVVAQANGAGANLITNGDFESSSSIDNRTTTTALAAWKSTGKPPGIFPHVHTVDPLAVGAALWNDPCSTPSLSDPSAPNRGCSMLGNVMSGGDHDAAEKPGGAFGSNTQDRARLIVSPTINMKTDGIAGSAVYNNMGLNWDLVSGFTEYALWVDQHTAGFLGNVNGNFRSIGGQAYPARQRNGIRTWGEARFPLAITFFSVPSCGPSFIALRSPGLVGTSNANGIPDSLRVQWQFLSRCFTFAPHTAATCSPNAGTNVGNYIDNLSFAFIKGTPAAGFSVFPWFWYVDAFPATTSTDFTSPYGAGLAFDTTTALMKSAINRSLLTGLTRPSVLGDSAQITTGLAPSVRVDLVFRILPGVGNHVTIGNRATALRRVPTSTTAAVANAASTNFWESYLGNNGEKGTVGGHAGGVWSPHVWNSARMDTMEQNLFPALSLGNNLPLLDGANWQTMYNELDPKFATLGIAKNRCFVVDPSVGRGIGCVSKAPTSVVQCNVICGTVPSAGSFDGTFPPLAYTGDVSSGYFGVVENGLPAGKTYEFTKILPDGQFTPGTHIQYFYRREPGTGAAVDLQPDTTQVFTGAQTDGARWFVINVLPDRWKHPGFGAGGSGMACMLVVDVHDRSGDEFFWTATADSNGMTAANKRGAHNGFTAAGGINSPGTFDQATFRRDNGGQAGTTWDLYNTRAGESGPTGSAWLSNRGAVAIPAAELMAGMEARTGPTPDMLRHFYRSLVFMTGSLTTQFFGRVANRTDDDIALLDDFLLLPGTGARSVAVIGQGFCETLTQTGGPANGQTFLADRFGVSFGSGVAASNKAYRTFSGNPKQVVEITPNPGSAFDVAGAPGFQGYRIGVSDGCGIENDVLAVNPGVATAVKQSEYENVGTAGPYIHSIYAGPGGTRTYATYLDGSRIQRLGTYNPVNTVLPMGRLGHHIYMYKALTIMAIPGVGCGPVSAPVSVGDQPGSSGTAFANYLSMRSENPMKRSREARIGFGLAKTERVEVRVFDVTGRLVKMVANRTFAGGQEHVVTWDGTDEVGNKVRSGVYFTQLKAGSWTSQKKLAVLAD